MATSTPLTVMKKSEPPVARMELTVASDNGTLPGELVQAYARQSKYYSNVAMKLGQLLPGGTARSPIQQFTIEGAIARRSPNDYTSRLMVAPPKPAKIAENAPEGNNPPPANNFEGGPN